MDDPAFVPTNQDELKNFLATNSAADKRALAPVGGGTALDFGGPLLTPALKVQLDRLDRVVDYPARDMTVTVEAGIRMDRLAELLSAEGQRLPIDIAQPGQATLGGAIATNTSGPRRFGYGTFRDYVIGLTAMTAEGRVFHSGGRVVKNVAGYDLCKLLIGSLGTLAVVTQVTLKLKPLCESSILVHASFNSPADREAAVAGLLTSATRPIAIETLNQPAAALIENEARSGLPPSDTLLIVGFEGSAPETDWQAEILEHELVARRAKDVSAVRGSNAERLWTSLTAFPVDSGEALAFQATVLPSKVASFEDQASRLGVAIVSNAGDGTVTGKLARAEGGPSQTAEIAASLAAAARECGGFLICLRGDPAGYEGHVTHDRASGAWSLMRQLKQTLDPANLLNPGRLFRE